MKRFLLYISFVFFALAANAQTDVDIADNNPKKEEKIKALYVAYITQQLNFTPQEAEKFWPIHAQYDAELKAINSGNASELDRQQSILNVKKKYVGSFSKIIGNDRSNKFYGQDEQFRKKLVDRLKQMRQQRKNNVQQQSGGRRKQ